MSAQRATQIRSFRCIVWLAILLLGAALFAAETVSAQNTGWSQEVGDVVNSVAMSTDAAIQVVGSRNNLVSAFDQTGKLLWQFQPAGTVWGVAVAADGSRVAVAAEDRRVYLLDGAGTKLWEFAGARIFLDVAVSRDGSLVAAVAEDRAVYALNGATGEQLWRVELPNVADTVTVYGGSQPRIVAGTRDSQVHLLNTDGVELWRAQLRNAVKGVAVVSNGARIVAVTDPGDVVMLNGANTDIVWTTPLRTKLRDVAITADGSLILTGAADGALYMLGGQDGAVQQSRTDDAPIEAVALAPDGRFYMVGTRTGGASFATVAAFASEFEAQQRLRVVLTVVAPLLFVALVVLFIVWVSRSASGRQFWTVYAARPRRVGAQMWRHRMSYFFLLPTITLLLIFNYYPAFSGLYHSFTVWRPGIETRWVGLQHFETILHSAYFWVGVQNAVILVIAGYVKVFTVPLLVAELLFAIRNRFLQYGLRSLFIIPLVVPGVVGILVWVNIYDPNIGLLNQMLHALGLSNLTNVWLGNANTALAAIIGIGFPWVSPFALLIFYGGLISIPQELFDAAKVDGASSWRRFLSVDVPLLMSQFRLLLILGFIGSVQEFQSIFLTTGGGPGNVTYTPALELYYQAVRFNNFGLASAMGTVLFLVILGGTIFYMRTVTSAVEYEA